MYNLTPENSGNNINIDLDLLKAKVSALCIKSEDDNFNASRLLGEIDNALEEITGTRDSIIGEYEKRIADTKAEYLPYILRLQEFKKTVKAEMLSYRERARMEIKSIHDDINSGKIERHEIFVDENGKMVNKNAVSIRTGEGLSTVRTHIKIVVTDLARVPDTYKKIDMKRAMDDVKKGIKDIPGIEIIEKPVMQYRGRSTNAA
jgi:hypothetical protein